jgi:hypothetical protein
MKHQFFLLSSPVLAILIIVMAVVVVAPTTGAYIMPGSPEWASLESNGAFDQDLRDSRQTNGTLYYNSHVVLEPRVHSSL